jgi:hypothetical protein
MTGRDQAEPAPKPARRATFPHYHPLAILVRK